MLMYLQQSPDFLRQKLFSVTRRSKSVFFMIVFLRCLHSGRGKYFAFMLSSTEFNNKRHCQL